MMDSLKFQRYLSGKGLDSFTLDAYDMVGLVIRKLLKIIMANVMMVAARMEVASENIKLIHFEIVTRVMKSLSVKHLQGGGALPFDMTGGCKCTSGGNVLPLSYFSGGKRECSCDCKKDGMSGGGGGSASLLTFNDTLLLLAKTLKQQHMDEDCIDIIRSSLNANLNIIFNHIPGGKVLNVDKLREALAITHPYIAV